MKDVIVISLGRFISAAMSLDEFVQHLASFVPGLVTEARKKRAGGPRATLCESFGCPWNPAPECVGPIPCLTHWQDLQAVFRFDPEDWMHEVSRLCRRPQDAELLEERMEQGLQRFAQLRKQL